jgi:hypothetical protein
MNYKDWIRWHKCLFRKNAKNSLALTFSSAGILSAVLRASFPQLWDEQNRQMFPTRPLTVANVTTRGVRD